MLKLAEGAAGKAEMKLGGQGEKPGMAGGGGTDEGDEGVSEIIEAGSQSGGPGPGGESKGGVTVDRGRERKAVEFQDDQVTIPANEGDAGEVVGEFLAEADKGEARVPFEKVLVKYRAEMEKAMENEAYPEEYRRAVKDYFDSLK